MSTICYFIHSCLACVTCQDSENMNSVNIWSQHTNIVLIYCHRYVYQNVQRRCVAAAVSSVKRKELSLHAAAREYGVPRSTLIDHVAGRHMGPVGRGTDLTPEDETHLVAYINHMASVGPPATRWLIKQKVGMMVNSYGTY